MQENAFENVRNLAVILLRPQCVDSQATEQSYDCSSISEVSRRKWLKTLHESHVIDDTVTTKQNNKTKTNAYLIGMSYVNKPPVTSQ